MHNILEGLNRELKEEINCNVVVTEKDYLVSNLMESKRKQIDFTFLCKKIKQRTI